MRFEHVAKVPEEKKIITPSENQAIVSETSFHKESKPFPSFKQDNNFSLWTIASDENDEGFDDALTWLQARKIKAEQRTDFWATFLIESIFLHQGVQAQASHLRLG